MPRKAAFPTTSKEPSLNTTGFCTARSITTKIFLTNLWNRLCLNFFSRGERKCLADPMASWFMVNWGLIFSSILKCCIQTQKLGYDWQEPELNFTWIATTPTLVLQSLIAYSTLVVLLSSLFITKNGCTYLHILLWSSTIWRLYELFLSFPLDIISSSKNSFSTRLHFIELLLQWILILHYRIVQWKSVLESTLWSETNQNTEKWSANGRFCCCR